MRRIVRHPAEQQAGMQSRQHPLNHRTQARVLLAVRPNSPDKNHAPHHGETKNMAIDGMFHASMPEWIVVDVIEMTMQISFVPPYRAVQLIRLSR